MHPPGPESRYPQAVRRPLPTPRHARLLPGLAPPLPRCLASSPCFAVSLLPCLALPLAGCLDRTITINTEPQGAVIWLNDQEVGRSPVTTGFRWYGAYEVRARKEGFEPLTTTCVAHSPWYEYPGPDLLAEALPARIRNRVVWDLKLTPLPGPDQQAEAAVVDRARAFRAEHE